MRTSTVDGSKVTNEKAGHLLDFISEVPGSWLSLSASDGTVNVCFCCDRDGSLLVSTRRNGELGDYRPFGDRNNAVRFIGRHRGTVNFTTV